MCGLLSWHVLVCGIMRLEYFLSFHCFNPFFFKIFFFNLVLINQMECLMTPACSCLIYNMLFFLSCFFYIYFFYNKDNMEGTL